MTKRREIINYINVYENEVFVGKIEDKLESIANLVASASPFDRFTLVASFDILVLKTRGSFLDSVPDKKFLKELLVFLVPLQTGEKELNPVVYKKVIKK